jgi:hypothetical protein
MEGKGAKKRKLGRDVRRACFRDVAAPLAMKACVKFFLTALLTSYFVIHFQLLELTRRDGYNPTCSRQSTNASHAYLPVSAPQLPSSTFLADCEETDLQPSLNV